TNEPPRLPSPVTFLLREPMPLKIPATSPQLAELPPLLIYTAVTVALIGVLLLAAWWLGARTTSRNKEMPYESGVIPSGSARRPLSVPFYLVAIFFIVFDVESAFIFIWAAV